MLKKRIITAILLAPLAIAALFLPNILFDILIGIVAALAGWEYSQLIKLTKPSYQYIFLAILIILFTVGLFFPLPFLFAATIWWLAASLLMIKFPLGQKQWFAWPWLPPLIGLVMICPAAIGLCQLHQLPSGWGWVLLLLLMVWSADIGAFFVGKYFGKQPLAPLVSPKKTTQGVYGGLVAVLIVVGIYVFFWHFSIFRAPYFLILILLSFMLSVIGDLVESGIKRWMDVKDSGNMLPGHGGLLDRIDSLLAAAPVFALGVILLLGNMR
ncbi:MAG: phosphatidate cytidylyltransferase [Gammaproteobacteria bacterium]